jgi:hypothetical protein
VRHTTQPHKLRLCQDGAKLVVGRGVSAAIALLARLIGSFSKRPPTVGSAGSAAARPSALARAAAGPRRDLSQNRTVACRHRPGNPLKSRRPHGGSLAVKGVRAAHETRHSLGRTQLLLVLMMADVG